MVDPIDADADGRVEDDTIDAFAKLLRRQCLGIEREGSAQRLCPGSEQGLISAQGDRDEWHLVDENIVQAVHAAVRDRRRRAAQDRVLWDVVAHDEMLRHGEGARVDFVRRQNHDAIPLAKRLDEDSVQSLCMGTEDGAQRDVEHALALQPLQRKVDRFLAFMDRRANEQVAGIEIRDLTGEVMRGIEETSQAILVQDQPRVVEFLVTVLRIRSTIL